MPYPPHSSREEGFAKASTRDSNDDEGNISDFSDYPSSGARLPDLSGRRKHGQPASTIRSVLGRFHREASESDRSEHGERGSRVGGLLEAGIISTSEIYQHVEPSSNTSIADSSGFGGSVRTLRPSPKMIGNPIKVPAREPPPIPPLEPISDESSNNDDEYYEDMEEGDEEDEEDEGDEEDEEEGDEEDDEENKVIEINEAKEVKLHRVQQGSRAIRIKEMLRRGPARAPVVPPPRSDSFNVIPNLSNSQGSQLLDQGTIFETGLETGFESPLRIKGLPAVPFEVGNISGFGQSSVEKDRWPNESGGVWRKPVPNSADGPNSYSLHRASSVQRPADSQGKSPACSPVAHSKQYHSHYKTIGYSRLGAANLHAQDVKIAPDGVNNLPGVDFVPWFSRTQSEEENITSLRRRPIPETDESEHVESPASPYGGLGSWRNPVINREDGLRSHPTSPQFARPTVQRAPVVPFGVNLGRPLPPLPSPTSSPALTRKNTQE